MVKNIEKVAAFSFGVIFVIALLVLATLYPTPTHFQYMVFKVVLALASAGVGAMIPGFLHLQVSTWVRAGGALAIFFIVFFYNPAELVATKKQRYSYEYENSGKSYTGLIEQAEGGAWIEYTREGERDLTYHFREVDGDPGWTTLYDSGRKAYVRFRNAGGQMQYTTDANGPWYVIHLVTPIK